ncbi:MAG: spore maturation protein [Clostridia bacterium]|nr:spore maturation protein [Clostridia bacterium]
MNIVFGLIVICALVLLCIQNPAATMGYLLEGTSEAVNLALKLVAVYALWMGMLKIAERSGIERGVSRLFRPLLRRMFKGESEHTQTLIGMNLTANLLGMGGAATPLGIKAIESMSKGEDHATDSMLLFFVLNLTSVQILPGTIIALRAAAGSATPSDIILPSILSTLITCVISVVLTYVFRFLWRKMESRKIAKTRAKANYEPNK